jgi:hypothetical protein
MVPEVMAVVLAQTLRLVLVLVVVQRGQTPETPELTQVGEEEPTVVAVVEMLIMKMEMVLRQVVPVVVVP